MTSQANSSPAGAPSAEPTRPSVRSAEPTRPSVRSAEPTRPSVRSAEPTRPSVRSAEPTRPNLSAVPDLVDPTEDSTEVPATLPGTQDAPLSDDPDEIRRVTRDPNDAWVGGVASGIAHHLGWPVMTVRLGFVALSFVYSLGVFVYGVLWLLLPVAEPDSAPGLESATRRGLRQSTTRNRTADLGAITGLGLLAGGLVWVSSLLGVGVQARYFWPLAFAATGLALVWRQADDRGAQVPSGTPGRLRPLVTLGGWPALIRIVLGLVLLLVAFFLLLANRIPLASLPWVLSTSALVIAGAALVGAPWIYRARRKLQANQQARVLADARADVAAHLHDSVLQTLALIQRQADDPRAVGALARRQERELRAWLYGGMADQTQLKDAVSAAGHEVENERGVPVEVVFVGDTQVTPNLTALVQAAREAMMNAAKHSGAPVIDVYGEVDQGRVELFIRDRGKGFDPAVVPGDRMGVRGSITERMERHGGRATIRSTPQQGTEVRLEMQA